MPGRCAVPFVVAAPRKAKKKKEGERVVGSHHGRTEDDRGSPEGGRGREGRKTGRRRGDRPFIFVVPRAARRVYSRGWARIQGSAVAGIYCDHPQGCIYIHKHNGAS